MRRATRRVVRRRAQIGSDPLVGLDEGGEIARGIARGNGGFGESVAIFLGESDNGGGLHGAFEMEVQFGFGQQLKSRRPRLYRELPGHQDLPEAGFRGEFAMPAAVARVDHEADREPHDKTNPGDHREAHHQSAAQNDGDQREPRDQGNPKAALPLRVFTAQEDHSQRHQHKGEKRSDIGKIRRIADGKDSRGDAHG